MGDDTIQRKYSARATFRLGGEQECTVECLAEFSGGNGTASEISNSDNIRRRNLILYEMAARVTFTIPFAKPKFGAPSKNI
jgi:hypothetical protein